MLISNFAVNEMGETCVFANNQCQLKEITDDIFCIAILKKIKFKFKFCFFIWRFDFLNAALKLLELKFWKIWMFIYAMVYILHVLMAT